MLAIPLNINGRDFTVHCVYCPPVPLDPYDPNIKAEPERIIIDKVLDSKNEVIKLDSNLFKVIVKECMIQINNLLSGVI